MPTSYAMAKVKVRAEIGGADFEVAACSVDYGLNMIPRCSLRLAVGRNVKSQTPAAVHSAGSSLEHMSPLKVYADLEGDFSDSEQWPGGENLIFEGYLTGCGYQKQRGAASFGVEGIHWLSDLDFSTVLSEISHPSNPWSMTTHAIRPNSGTTMHEKPTLTHKLSGAKFFEPSKVGNDLWGESIQPYFCELAKANLSEIKYFGGDSCNLTSGGNRKALKALEKMEGGGCSTVGNKYSKKLSMKTGEAGHALKKAISGYFNTAIADADYFSSFWGVLLNRLGASFLFSVVPMADRALVVPYVPNLRNTYRREIYVEDQDMLNYSKSFSRPLKGVIVYAGCGDRCGVPDNKENKTPAKTLTGGCYTPYGPDDPGMILTQAAPGWLQDIVPAGSDVRKTANQGRQSTTTPESSGKKTEKTPEELAKGSGDIYTALAKAMFHNEILRGRNGSNVGKLRFDISPGSSVKIHGSAEKHTSGDQLGSNMIGSVVRVSCSMDAESRRCSTGFHFTAMRTEHENDSDKLTTSEHPLYGQSFDGAPLVTEYEM